MAMTESDINRLDVLSINVITQLQTVIIKKNIDIEKLFKVIDKD